MESQQNQSGFAISQPYSINKNMKSQRSLPIPKQVNTYVLNNYGAQYYNSNDSARKNEILKHIESQCHESGYLNISAMEIERRLKNMKSHYRRKKVELETGAAQTIAWEYFDMLDSIFKDIDKEEEKMVEQKLNPTKKIFVPIAQKRPPEEEKKPKEEISAKPQDV